MRKGEARDAARLPWRHWDREMSCNEQRTHMAGDLPEEKRLDGARLRE